MRVVSVSFEEELGDTTDLNNWDLISGDVVGSYTTYSLLQGTCFYRVKVTAADCSDFEEDFYTITVNVYPELMAGALTPPETICYEVEPITIGFDTNQGPTGDNNYDYTWYKNGEVINLKMVWLKMEILNFKMIK